MLVKAIWSKNNLIDFADSGNKSIALGGSENVGVFDWISSALSNGVSVPVNVSKHVPLMREQGNNRRFGGDTERDDDDANGERGGSEPKVIGFELPLSADVVWDPQLAFTPEFAQDSFTSDGASQGKIPVFLISVLAMLMAF